MTDIFRFKNIQDLVLIALGFGLIYGHIAFNPINIAIPYLTANILFPKIFVFEKWYKVNNSFNFKPFILTALLASLLTSTVGKFALDVSLSVEFISVLLYSGFYPRENYLLKRLMPSVFHALLIAASYSAKDFYTHSFHKLFVSFFAWSMLEDIIKTNINFKADASVNTVQDNKFIKVIKLIFYTALALTIIQFPIYSAVSFLALSNALRLPHLANTKPKELFQSTILLVPCLINLLFIPKIINRQNKLAFTTFLSALVPTAYLAPHDQEKSNDLRSKLLTILSTAVANMSSAVSEEASKVCFSFCVASYRDEMQNSFLTMFNTQESNEDCSTASQVATAPTTLPSRA